MASLTGITVVQRFTYRGDPNEEFSNTYHFRDNPPSTSADWDAFFTALIPHLQPIFPSDVHIVRAYGYDTDDAKPVSVWTKDLALTGDEVPGTCPPPVSSPQMGGDQAALVEWKLDHKNSRGKYVYLRKYLHAGFTDAGVPDNLAGAYVTALQAYANALGTAGSGFHGGLRARTGTWPILQNIVSPFVTTRTLHRRGKRPPLAA